MFVQHVYEMAVVAFDGTGNLGTALAALFDLAVTALYLERVPNSDWLYCSNGPPTLSYPFVNACPRCALRSDFHFVKARKPESASIGKATSTILSAFLDCQAAGKAEPIGEYSVRTLSDNGMVDALLIGPGNVCLLEIKASPLIAFPLEAACEPITELDSEDGDLVPVTNHSKVVTQNGVDASLIIDGELRIPVGSSEGFPHKAHYEALLTWLNNGENLATFVASWRNTFAGYAEEDARTSTYWLTNGCGAPKPRPTTWPRRSGTGYETISDPKSSVGLDRTDDLKKGIYQALKISTHFKEFFPSDKYRVYVALVTNIHAVKHRSDYLSELEDLVWTVDGSDRSYVLRRGPEETVIATPHLYNLFDAVISFTAPFFRDDFLREIYAFN